MLADSNNLSDIPTQIHWKNLDSKEIFSSRTGWNLQEIAKTGQKQSKTLYVLKQVPAVEPTQYIKVLNYADS